MGFSGRAGATWILVLGLGVPMPARAQTGALEVFAHGGWFRAGSDEGRIGTALSYGSALRVPLRSRLAADFNIQTARITRTIVQPAGEYITRRTLLVPSVVYLLPAGPVVWHLGAGIGAEIERSTGSGVLQSTTAATHIAPALHGGLTAFGTRRVGIRADVFLARWHTGVRLGVGVRFD